MASPAFSLRHVSVPVTPQQERDALALLNRAASLAGLAQITQPTKSGAPPVTRTGRAEPGAIQLRKQAPGSLSPTKQNAPANEASQASPRRVNKTR